MKLNCGQVIVELVQSAADTGSETIRIISKVMESSSGQPKERVKAESRASSVSLITKFNTPKGSIQSQTFEKEVSR